MKLEHRFSVPAPFDVVWAALDDLEDLVPCVPGATLTSAEGDEFAGTVKVKLGPISLTYNGTGRFVERDRASGRVVVEAKGKDRRGNGTAGATVVARVNADGDATAVELDTDLTVTGKPAQFGRGVIQDVSNALLGQFVDCLSAKLTADEAVDDAATADDGTGGSTAAAPSQSAGDAGDSRDAGNTAAGRSDGGTARGGDAAGGGAAAGGAAGGGVAGGGASPHAAPHTSAAAPAELNLLGAVMPVLAQRAALPVAVTALVLAVIALFRRRSH